MRQTLLALTAFALVGSTTALAAEAPCLNQAEFSALAAYSMPSAIEGLTERCGPSLPKNAYLKTDGQRLAARYAVRREAVWPSARAAFLKLGADNAEAAGLFSSLPDEALRPLVDGLISGMVSQKLPTDRCGAIDRLVNLLSPLPPENTAELIGLAVIMTSKESGRGKVGKLTICPAR